MVNEATTIENIGPNLFKTVLDDVEVGVHIVDNKGLTLFYNNAAEKIDGIKKEDILGKNMHDLVEKGIFSESVALDVIEQGKPVKITQKVNNRLIYATGKPVFESGELKKVIVYCRDIEILESMSRQLAELRKENARITRDLTKYSAEYLSSNQILNRSKEMNNILKLADKVANVDSTILIEGESGVGKSMLAKYIHENSGRYDKPFVKVDCSSIPETLIESELFGYEEGSFTGALKGGKKGLIQYADTGTLFLDEIGELPLSSQVKLLSLIQFRQIQPIGAHENIDVDVRIISATNQNLRELIDEGKFREDLYYRLQVVPILIPPLRERNADIVPLIKLFLSRLNSYYNLNKEISPSALKYLLDYSWPGNVRELENTIERLIVTSDTEIIDQDDVRFSLNSDVEHSDVGLSHKEIMEEYEKKLIKNYASNHSTIRDMARSAKIDESTLRKKIQRYGINLPKDK
ncbi:sigma-54 interaction domain-containing protein [Gudongella sp. SC589]|uniref:sigma-54 interaction domain-containing protein n=1 Tax=Gudongella sp. SC589 TaxID=3385990 RepID=UPI003904BECE